MGITLSKAVKIALEEVKKRRKHLDPFFTESDNGWCFSFRDEQGLIAPNDSLYLITRHGEIKQEFRRIPPKLIENGIEIDISEYL